MRNTLACRNMKEFTTNTGHVWAVLLWIHIICLLSWVIVCLKALHIYQTSRQTDKQKIHEVSTVLKPDQIQLLSSGSDTQQFILSTHYFVSVVVDVRDGRPGVFLRVLRVPAERRHDEPVLHLRCLPEVSPVLPGAFSCHAQMGIREERMNFFMVHFIPQQLAVRPGEKKNSFMVSLCCQIWMWSTRLTMTFLKRFCAHWLSKRASLTSFHCSCAAAVDWAAWLPQCVFSSITARWVRRPYDQCQRS